MQRFSKNFTVTQISVVINLSFLSLSLLKTLSACKDIINSEVESEVKTESDMNQKLAFDQT